MNEFDDQHLEEEHAQPSKTRIKKECDDLQKTGEALIDLNQDELAAMTLPDSLRDAVNEARRLKSRSGLKRQRQYIGKLMREIDADAVRQQLDALRHKHDSQNAAFKQTEHWRDRLLGGDHDALTELLDEYPQIDHQHLKQLVRQARKELQQDKPPAAARKLFRYIREFVDP